MKCTHESCEEFSEFIDRKRTLTELRIAHKDSSDSSRSHGGGLGALGLGWTLPCVFGASAKPHSRQVRRQQQKQRLNRGAGASQTHHPALSKPEIHRSARTTRLPWLVGFSKVRALGCKAMRISLSGRANRPGALSEKHCL